MADDALFQAPDEHASAVQPADPDALTEPSGSIDTALPARAAGGTPEELPDRVRVHSLARLLGTTSRRVLDALTELDGKVRSAQSSLVKAEALRVRDLLESASANSGTDSENDTGSVSPQTGLFSAASGSTVPGTREISAEPESRTMLEEPGGYMPLFVAPQQVVARDERKNRDDRDDRDDDTDTASGDSLDDDYDAEDEVPPASRRRRRGRRGRGRGRGSDDTDKSDDSAGGGSDDTDDTADSGGAGSGDSDDSDSDGPNGADDNDSDDGNGSRRRRRRRRRKTGDGETDNGNGNGDDPPNTVVHERAPRKSGKGNGDDEIQGITGSTRLEAKRQRRRDGRDAGRRRAPILSEAEFLARRESVQRTMVVRDRVRTEPPHQGARYTQIAVLEDGVLVEHFVTSAASASLVGNVYLGIVQNVLPSMEAAFVDIGRGRNGVLYAGEVNWEAAGLGGSNRKIEQALKPGDYVVVQVSKDPVGHKGARLTTQVSLAGRYLVYVPGASSTGISRKLPDTERQRLKEILREVVPSDAGVIIRTASEGVKEEDIRADVARLQQRWAQIESTAAETREKAPGAALALYEEPDVLVKVVRDLFNDDFSELVVSGDEAWQTITGYLETVAPELMTKVARYTAPSGPDGQGGPDVFAVHRIDEQLAKAMDRKVWLPSGGTLVIDRTEAMTVVDVNTGKFTGSGGNLEETVTKNNLEAAEEIVRQLRLRDIGGIVVIDFIDMVLESNRDLVLRRLVEALGRDRTRHQVSEVTSLGLVQLTRKRLGTGLIEAFSTSCSHCAGRGIILHGDPVDSSAPGRKADGNGRKSRRSKKKTEDPVVAKVPVNPVGEHPMFKAMAAASRGDDDEDVGEEAAGDGRAGTETIDAGTDERSDTGEFAVGGSVESGSEAPEASGLGASRAEPESDADSEADEDDDRDDDDRDDYDDQDDDQEDDVEVDLDDDEDFDDDYDVIDDARGDSGRDDSAGAEETSDSGGSGFGRPGLFRRRRAAARPAGPPSGGD